MTQQLVKLLNDDAGDVRQRAGVALREMSSEGGDESQRAVAMAGGVAPLVALLQDGLRDGMVEAQEYAAEALQTKPNQSNPNQTKPNPKPGRYALWSLSLVTDPTSRRTIVADRGIQLLIDCLVRCEVSDLAQEHASATLAVIARDRPNCDDVVGLGGIAPLVQLLSYGTTGAKKHAALGLARLAANGTSTQAAIADAGAIVELHRWLLLDVARQNKQAEGTLPDLAAHALTQASASECSGGLRMVSDRFRWLPLASDSHLWLLPSTASGCFRLLPTASDCF